MNDTISLTRPTPQPTNDSVKLVKSEDTNKPKYQSEPIGLPSNGHFYPKSSPLHTGIVDVKYMTAKEEDILTSQNLIKKGIVLERLLESLVITPGVKIDDLLIGDKNALFVASRRLAYGDSYGPLNMSCPKCNKENKCTVDLSKVANKEYDFSKYPAGSNEFEFTLSVSKKILTFKLLTHKDEQAIEHEIEAVAKISKNGASPEVTTRLKRMIVAIDGNQERGIINKFVDNEFLSRESLAFRNHVKEMTPDVDMNFDFSCSECQHEERVGIPLAVSFFWPNS